MGFFKKVLGGIAKPFRKVLSKTWKGIKSGFKKVMGFIGKLGIVGQIGLSLLLPGLGELVGGWAATMMASGNAIVSGAGHVLNAAINIGTKVKGVVGSVTKGIGKVVGQTVGTLLNKIPGADKFVLDFTKQLGLNAGNGIDISKMTDFSKIGTTFSEELSKVSTATSDLFSKGTFTDLNSYAKDALIRDQAIQKTLETAQVNVDTNLQESNLSNFEKMQEKNMSLLEEPKLDGREFSLSPNDRLPSKGGQSMTASFTSPPLPDASQFTMPETPEYESIFKGTELEVKSDLSSFKPDAPTNFDVTKAGTGTASLLEDPTKTSLGTKLGKAVTDKLGGPLTKANLLSTLDSSEVGTYEGGYGGGTTFDVPDVGPMTAGGMTAEEINFFNLVPSLEIRGLTLPANYQPQSDYARAMANLV